jgi:hypothetical protein
MRLETPEGIAQMAEDRPIHHRDAYDVAYEHTPRVLAIQRARNKARYHMVKKYGEAMLQGKDVDHIDPLAAGGAPGGHNVRVISAHDNRADKTVFKKKGYRPIHVP